MQKTAVAVIGVALAVSSVAPFASVANARGFGMGVRAPRFAGHFRTARGVRAFRAFRRAPLNTGFVALPYGAPACVPSQEVVTVPAEDGGPPVEITITRCY